MDRAEAKTWFDEHVRKVLNALYNPSVLQNSPMVSLLGIEQRRNVAMALQRCITGAIEALRPNANTPPDSRTWRVYQVLRRRYTEQVTQREVANDLGLSVRQLQREEKLAREVLADYLWMAHNLADKSELLGTFCSEDENEDKDNEWDAPTRDEELAHLQNTVPAQIVGIEQIVDETLNTLKPLFSVSRTSYTCHFPDTVPALYIKPPMLRQALLNVISTAIRCGSDARIHIDVEVQGQQVSVSVATHTNEVTPRPEPLSHKDSLDMAQQFIQLCAGTLDIAFPTKAAANSPDDIVVFSATILIPTAEQITVLVVDDNADVLQLFERYLTGSRFRFIGAQDTRRGLALAQEYTPHIIVLDVMMPDKDGWTLLGQLREHPKTQDIPVIVCSILSQESLALALGAAAFIRKPVKQAALLAALDKQIG